MFIIKKDFLSKIKEVNKIDFNKKIIINNIIYNENNFNYIEILNVPDNQKDILINNLIIKETIINVILDYLISCFSIIIDNKEFEQIKNTFFVDKQIENSQLINSKKNNIKFEENEKWRKEFKKMLIYKYIEKQYNLFISDEEFNIAYQHFKNTYKNIVLNDNKFYWILLQNKIDAFLINNFNYDCNNLVNNIDFDTKRIKEKLNEFESFSKDLVNKKIK